MSMRCKIYKGQSISWWSRRLRRSLGSGGRGSLPSGFLGRKGFNPDIAERRGRADHESKGRNIGEGWTLQGGEEGKNVKLIAESSRVNKRAAADVPHGFRKELRPTLNAQCTGKLTLILTLCNLFITALNAK